MSDESKQEVFKGVYDHLRMIREDESSSKSTLLQKIHWIMTAQVWLFASLSVASSQVEWASGTIHLRILVFFALVAGLSLAYGFYYCLSFLGIEEAPVLGVKELGKAVKSGDLEGLKPEELFGDLSQNVVDQINRDRANEAKRKTWGRRVNRSTRLGFIAAVLFLVYAIGGQELSSAGTKDTEIDVMSAVDPNESSNQDGQDATPANSTETEPVAEATPCVEPTRISLVEGGDTIAASNDPVRPGEQIVFGPDLEIEASE